MSESKYPARRNPRKNRREKSKRGLLALVLVLVFLAGTILSSTVGRRLYIDSFYPLDYSELVQKYAKENGLEEALVYSVIKCESGFDPNAESYVPAIGLMQITEDTFNWLTTKMGEEALYDLKYTDLFDPELNIKYGTFFLGYLINDLGSVPNAVAGYHAGINAAKRWLSDPQYSSDGASLYDIPFPTTKAYVEKVLATKEKYEEYYFN